MNPRPSAWLLKIKDGKVYRLQSFTLEKTADIVMAFETSKGFEVEKTPLFEAKSIRSA